MWKLDDKTYSVLPGKDCDISTFALCKKKKDVGENVTNLQALTFISKVPGLGKKVLGEKINWVFSLSTRNHLGEK